LSTVGTISLGLSLNTKNYDRQVNNIQSKTSKSFNTMSIAVGNIVANMAQKAAMSMAGFVTSSLKAGSDLAELQNVVDVVFTTMANKVDGFAKSALTSYGLTEIQAKKMVGTYGAMAKAFGFTESQSYDMSTALTGLAGDVSSFYNISSDEANTKLKSVFTGETESLKELGVVMTQAALDAFALSKGYSKTTASMTEQEKVALRIAFVQQQLSAASGDFSRTSESWANQTRILSGQFMILKTAIGQGLIAALAPALKVINALMGKLIGLANVFKSFMDAVTGGSTGAAGAAMASIADATGQASDNLSSMSDTAADTAKSAAATAESLMGFDKIQKLSDNSSSGADGSSGIIPIGSSASVGSGSSPQEVTPPNTSAFTDFISKVLDPLKVISFGNLLKGLDELKNAFKPLTSTLFDGLSWAYTNVLVPLAQWTIEDLIPAYFHYWSGIMLVFNSVLVALQPLATWLWDSFLAPLASWTGGMLVAYISGLGDVLKVISTWIDNNQKAFTAIVITIGAFALAWKGIELAQFIVNAGGIAGMIGKITLALKACTIAKLADKIATLQICAMYAKDFVVSIASTTAALVTSGVQWIANKAVVIGSTIATVAATVATSACAVATWVLNGALAVLTSPILLIVLAIAAVIAIIVLLVTHFDVVKAAAAATWQFIADIAIGISVWLYTYVIKPVLDFFQFLWNGIVAIFSGIGSWFSGVFTNAWNGILSAFSGMGGFFVGLWQGIQNVFGGVASWFGNIFANAWQGVKNVFSTGGEIFSGITDGIGQFFKTTVNAIISGMNWLISKPFDMVNGMLNRIRNVSFLGVSPFESMWGYNPIPVPRIPMLAQGGYAKANQPKLAIIGDNKTKGEFVAPEDKMYAMALKAAKEAVDNLPNKGGGSNNIIVKLYIEGKEIKDVVVKLVNQETIATGKCPIIN